ncbi:hypothetical protein [Paenibacillus arenilitoris]|uniref:Uncharacterized protein n=1 Tax=Paenibacillus arenilitoris TaxID=2772299 RepID=A0A927CHW1_9BACL|nr:hypothetical protein [Paenibacillus arenilitoris]MBD2868394.1 hypothetical protein [Paenibacillus arenilitoris]
MTTNFKKRTVLLSLFIAVFVLMSSIPLSFAASDPSVNKKVYLTKASYVQLTDANLIPSTKGATASFTFTIYNGDSSSINLVDYWARLKSKGGTSYSLTLLDKDNKKSISPKSSVSLTYYSEVNASVTLDQLVLSFIKFDFSVPGYERTVGQFTFPAGYSNQVKAGGYKGVKVNNSNVNVRIDQVNVTKSGDDYSINMSYVARNTNKIGVALPEYSYYMQTSKGLFQLKVKNTADQNLTLEPTVLNSIRLYGTIPATVPTTGWKLIITQKAGSSETVQVELPVVIFEVPVKISNTTSSRKTFTDENGTYEVNLQSVQRFPWNNDDNIVAKLLVTNKESVYLPLPELSGTMIVDGNINLTSQTIKNNGDIGLAPGGSTTITFVGKLPYEYQWNKFELELNETVGEDKVQVAEVTKSDVTAIYSVSFNNVYTQKSNGSQMSVTVTDVRTYSGDTNEIYAVFMDVTNNQTRSNMLPLFAGYFKTEDGNYYEATVVKSAEAISPTNKDQIIAYTELPPNVSNEGLQLILGEAFDDTGLVKESTAKPTGYIRAVQFGLPVENQDTLRYDQIKVGPYQVSLNHFNVFAYEDSLEIDLGGVVNRDYGYDGFSQSKLLFELEYEPSNEVIWSQVVDMEGKSEGSIQWQTGENYNSISKPMEQNKYWSSYTLNVYETFNGNKKKLFSKDIKFSSTINWLDGNH